MRRALAAGLLSCALAALAAHAQAPPEPAPPAGAQPTVTPPAAEGTDLATPPAPPPPHPPKAAAPRPGPAPPPAAADSAHEAEVAALRAEVNRLQSELDTARAAALPPPEESAGAPATRSPWEWLLVTALLALAAGFFLGWRLLDRRIRRKYGGLRIY